MKITWRYTTFSKSTVCILTISLNKIPCICRYARNSSMYLVACIMYQQNVELTRNQRRDPTFQLSEYMSDRKFQFVWPSQHVHNTKSDCVDETRSSWSLFTDHNTIIKGPFRRHSWSVQSTDQSRVGVSDQWTRPHINDIHNHRNIVP